MEIINESKFHNIGQGLFHSGVFYQENSYARGFSYVVDCGTQPYSKLIENAIDEFLYKEEVDNQADIITISHLDFDHISGLRYLLNRVERVGIIVLPYLTPFERLWLYLYYDDKYNNDGPNDGKGEYDFKWLKKFIFDPAGTLLQSFEQSTKIEKIIFVGTTAKRKKKNYFYEFEEGRNITKMTANKFKPNKREWYKINNRKDGVSKGDRYEKVEFLINLMVQNSCGFEFDYFASKVSMEKIKIFEERVEAILDDESIENVFSNDNSTKLKLLKDLYKEIAVEKNINNASVCLAITRINSNLQVIDMDDEAKQIGNFLHDEAAITREGRVAYLRRIGFLRKPFYHINIFGHLFTGDINLDDTNKDRLHRIYNPFIKHYSRKLGEIDILTVPHHGSKHNWNSKLLYLMMNALPVITAGLANWYGHPSQSVISDISNMADNTLVWVNEHQSYERCYTFRCNKK